MADIQEELVRDVLQGLCFPAGPRDVVIYATDRGGVEPSVLEALGQLPSRAFTSPEDVVISLPDRV